MIKVNDTVSVIDSKAFLFQAVGKVSEITGEVATVQFGNLRCKANLSQLKAIMAIKRR